MKLECEADRKAKAKALQIQLEERRREQINRRHAIFLKMIAMKDDEREWVRGELSISYHQSKIIHI